MRRGRRSLLLAGALWIALASCEGTTIRCDPTLSWTRDPPRDDASVPVEEPPPPLPAPCTAGACVITHVAAGPASTCVRALAGEVICFGANEHGQSAPRSSEPREAPPTWIVRESAGDAPDAGAGSVDRAPVIGGAHACAVVDGTLRCWGHPALTGGARGELVTIGLAAPVSSPAAGALHTCAMSRGPVGAERASPEPYCFGVWDGSDPAAGIAHPPRVVLAVRSVTTAAGFRTCGTDLSATMLCWGGVPPDGTPSLGEWAVSPRASEWGGMFTWWVALGPEHACSPHEQLRCWGNGDRGQLGDGARESASEPVSVVGLPERRIDAACAGGAGSARERDDGTLEVGTEPGFTCAVLLSRVWCWGANDRGQLGDGTTIDRAVATRIDGLEDVRTISCGGAHACALMGNGGVACWGANEHGQLGIPSSVIEALPLPVEIDVVPYER